MQVVLFFGVVFGEVRKGDERQGKFVCVHERMSVCVCVCLLCFSYSTLKESLFV